MDSSISAQLLEVNKKILAAQQPDQNWFYSTMAQSSAAIVGLLVLGVLLPNKNQRSITTYKTLDAGR